MNRKISSIITIVAIITLCVVRIFFDASPQQSIWIPFINFLGIPIATISVFSQVFSKCSNMVKGIFLIGFIILTVIAILILTGVLILSPMINDLILLITLLITLPSDLYCNFLSKH